MQQGERGSALWGTGTRGGDSRGSALWGKGGRRAGATLVSAALAGIILSFGASLPAGASNGKSQASTFVPAALLSQAQADPNSSYKVIIQGDGSTDADHLAHKLAAWAASADKGGDQDKILRDQVKSEFSSINGVAVTLTGKQITKIYSHANEGLLSITPDAPVQTSGNAQFTSSQLWPYEAGSSNNWNGDQNATVAANMPTIAIVDSG